MVKIFNRKVTFFVNKNSWFVYSPISESEVFVSRVSWERDRSYKIDRSCQPTHTIWWRCRKYDPNSGKTLVFSCETCPNLLRFDSGPLIDFSMTSWHQRSRRNKTRVKSHLSLETRATFRRGDVSKVGVTQIYEFRMQNQRTSYRKQTIWMIFAWIYSKTCSEDKPVAWLWGPVAKTKMTLHSRSSPTARLMSCGHRILYERSKFEIWVIWRGGTWHFWNFSWVRTIFWTGSSFVYIIKKQDYIDRNGVSHEKIHRSSLEFMSKWWSRSWFLHECHIFFPCGWFFFLAA